MREAVDPKEESRIGAIAGRLGLLVLLTTLIAAGCSCGGDAGASPLEAVSPETRAVYKDRCSICHDDRGRGQGPGGRSLNPLPPDFSDGGWQTAWSDDLIRKSIVGGGLAIGKTAQMPAYPDLEDTPELEEIIRLVRAFGE